METKITQNVSKEDFDKCKTIRESELSKYNERFKHDSGLFSRRVRELTLASIAIIWILAGKEIGNIGHFVIPLTFICISLFSDLLQYASLTYTSFRLDCAAEEVWKDDSYSKFDYILGKYHRVIDTDSDLNNGILKQKDLHYNFTVVCLFLKFISMVGAYISIGYYVYEIISKS